MKACSAVVANDRSTLHLVRGALRLVLEVSPFAIAEATDKQHHCFFAGAVPPWKEQLK
jgi:hypothetical protein